MLSCLWLGDLASDAQPKHGVEWRLRYRLWLALSGRRSSLNAAFDEIAVLITEFQRNATAPESALSSRWRSDIDRHRHRVLPRRPATLDCRRKHAISRPSYRQD